MVLVGVTAYMGAVLLAIGAAAGLFAFIGVNLGAPETPGFAITAVTGLFLGGSLRLAARGRSRRGGAREALAFILAMWAFAPALASAPFFAAAPEAGWARAYFDAVSALTTTGFRPVLADTPGHAALALWWNLLQWAGGAASLVGALVVLSALNLSGPGVHRSVLFTVQPDRLLERFVPVARAVTPIYGGVTMIVWLAIWIGGAPPDQAICLAMAAVATGGLWFPGGETAAAHLPLGALVGAAVGLAFGATSFVLHWDILRGRRPRAYLTHEESVGVLPLLALATLTVVLGGAALSEVDWARAGVEIIALVATAGWDVGGVGMAALGAPLAMGIVMVGGAPVSTAGGLKVLRMVLLFRHIGAELRRLAHPSSVADVRFRDRGLPHRTVMALLLHVLSFIIVIAGVTLVIAAGRAPFEQALAGAVAAVANTGPVALAGAPEDVARVFDDAPSLWALSLGMILGRVEVLAAFAALTPAFWRG